MTTAPTAQRERCPQCSAPMSFDATSRALRCGHCGARKEVAVAPEAAAVPHLERPLVATLQGLEQASPRGFDVATQSARCQQCGATVAFSEGSIATLCDFCGGPVVLLPDSSVRPLRPTGLIPFQVDQKAAQQQFSHWLRGLWFRPNDLRAKARIARMQGVYVPYWTFDATVQSRWTAESGTYYWETESYHEQGKLKTRQVQKTRWQPASGERRDAYDDVLVCASRGIPRDIARELGTFNTRTLVPWDARYLLGWHAEEYAVELGDAWSEAVSILEASQAQRCGSDVPGDTHRNLRVSNHYSDQSFKHVLLPVWTSTFRYGDKTFPFLVNGQTGEVRGRAPWSVVKIVLAVLAGLLLLLVFAALQQS